MKEENQSSDGNAAQTPHGIFSSPDLSVNSENLEEIKPELSEENKSRIASAFAKTDATQRQGQLADQMADQDAVSGTVIPATNSTTSTATGDIKLSGAKKKSKLPLILAGLALLAVIGGVVAWLVVGRSHSSAKEQALQEYDEYVVYLKDGPENLRTQSEDENIETDSTWFILNLRNLSLPVETQREYTDELLTRYKNLSDALINDLNNENTSNILSNYSTLLNSTIKLSAVDVLSNDLLIIYLERGGEDAYKFIETTTNSETESTLISSAMSSLAKYLEAQLTIIEIYSVHSCIIEGALDRSCEETLSSASPTYDSMLRNQDTMLRIMNQSLRSLRTNLEVGTEQIKEQIEANYE